MIALALIVSPSALAVEILADLETVEAFEAGATVTDLVEWLGNPRKDIKAAVAELKLAGLITSSSSRYFPIRGRRHGPRDESARRKQRAVALMAAGVSLKQAAAMTQISRRTIQRMAGGEA